MSAHSYAREKFSSALYTLASSSEPIQERLHQAFMVFHPVKADDFEDTETRSAFVQILDKLTRIKDDPHEEGLVEVTTRAMSDQDASALAHEICDFFFVHLEGPNEQRTSSGSQQQEGFQRQVDQPKPR